MYEKRRFWFYIVASRSRTLYCGCTSNLEERPTEHKLGIYGGFTAKYRIHRLVYYEEHDNVAGAINRERQVKRWSRAKKLALIETMNPTWIDFAEPWAGNAGLSTPLLRSSARDDVRKRFKEVLEAKLAAGQKP